MISYGDTTICIDYGDNLPGADRSRFESIDWENEKIDAVFFTHYHGDHIGRMMEIPTKVPLYMGGATRNVEMIIHKHLAGFGEDAAVHSRVLKRLEGIPAAQELNADQTVTIGKPGEEIRVTPYIVDHSAYEAWMLLVETPDKVILHTGDYRGHGYIGKNGKTMLNVIEKYVRRYGKRNVDILITEGTMMSRAGEKVLTERELQREARKLFKDNRHVLLICSSTNLDSLTSFYQAMTGLYPDSAIYGSQYLVEQLDYYSVTAGPKSGIYRFRNRFPYLAGSGGSKDTQTKRKKQQAMMRKNGFLCVIKPEEWYEKWVAPFRDLDPLFVYSMWDGYLDEKRHPHSYNPKWAAFRERHADRWVDLHTAGHATPELIREVIVAVDPREAIYPIHTENAEAFRNLDLPQELKERIQISILPDNRS